MSEATMELKSVFGALQLTAAAEALDELLMEAETGQLSYRQCLERVLFYELKKREERQLVRRYKRAAFPEIKTLDEFRIEEQPSLGRRQLNQLRELVWLEQHYNLLFLGPPGVGKTHLAIGLGVEALHQGYNVSFVTMGELMQLLKTQEISRNARLKVNRIVRCDLVILDDLMFMALNRQEAHLFFQFVNKLYGQASIILTSNKGPEDWGELLGEPAVTTAILDRILHRSEVIHLTGDSYRLKYRQTIFGSC